MVKELETADGIVDEVRKLECSEAEELSNRTSLLREQLQTLQRTTSARLETLKPYVSLLRSAEEVNVFTVVSVGRKPLALFIVLVFPRQ